MNKFFTIIIFGLLIVSCSENKIEKKGFQVSEITEDKNGQKVVGLQIDSLIFETRPRNVLLTYNPDHRLIPIYKVNYNKKSKEYFTGSNNYHTTWDYNEHDGNNWNHNYMPGFAAVYGYNFVNISHYDKAAKTEYKLFEQPVLIKTLYYPAFSSDTLNFKPISRNFYMVSVYDEDTNKDGFLNVKDLRRFYYFDIDGLNKKALIPENYSVMSSEYDSANDFMYIYAKKDQNNNGQSEINELTDIFWIDLKNPENFGLLYSAE